MIYSNFSFPKHFKQYLKIRNSQTLKTYLLCGCRPPLWWIEISIANTQFWSLPISLHIQCILYTWSENTKVKWVSLIGQKIPRSNELVWLDKKVVKKDQYRVSWFHWSRKTKAKFKWVGLIGQKDQDQIQIQMDWSKRPLTWSRWPHQVLAKRIQWESAENLVIINQPINLSLIHHLTIEMKLIKMKMECWEEPRSATASKGEEGWT